MRLFIFALCISFLPRRPAPHITTWVGLFEDTGKRNDISLENNFKNNVDTVVPGMHDSIHCLRGGCTQTTSTSYNGDRSPINTDTGDFKRDTAVSERATETYKPIQPLSIMGRMTTTKTTITAHESIVLSSAVDQNMLNANTRILDNMITRTRGSSIESDIIKFNDNIKLNIPQLQSKGIITDITKISDGEMGFDLNKLKTLPELAPLLCAPSITIKWQDWVFAIKKPYIIFSWDCDCREPRKWLDNNENSGAGEWDYNNGELIMEHGQTSWCGGRQCTCNYGKITCSSTCAKRKNIRYTWTKERKALINAMHWVKDGCPQTKHPSSHWSGETPANKCIDPDTGVEGWSLKDFFEDHIQYDSAAHGQYKFFPWHRKYLKEYETVLQQYNKCVMIPYWDWTQDSGNEDSIPWLPKCADGTGCAGTPGTHNGDWGKLGHGMSDNNDEPFGDGYGGMPNGRFQCDATAPLDSQWDLDSYALGSNAAGTTSGGGPLPCLFRNSLTQLSVPSAADINSYMATTNYDDLFAFESSPHGTPHVMIGGSAQSGYAPRGQMGDGRSPFDPIFWIHHAGVDRLWYNWQNDDPSKFWDYGGATFPSQSIVDRLGGSGQWDNNPTTSTYWKVQDVFDSENDLEVCYQEGIVFYPIPWPFTLDFLELTTILPKPWSDGGRRRLDETTDSEYESTSGQYEFVQGQSSNPYSDGLPLPDEWYKGPASRTWFNDDRKTMMKNKLNKIWNNYVDKRSGSTSILHKNSQTTSSKTKIRDGWSSTDKRFVCGDLVNSDDYSTVETRVNQMRINTGEAFDTNGLNTPVAPTCSNLKKTYQKHACCDSQVGSNQNNGCICTKEYAPVCCGGKTFSNLCMAKCECTSDIEAGECGCPANCKIWFDGCNTCQCLETGKLGACTRKMCLVFEEAKCIQSNE